MINYLRYAKISCSSDDSDKNEKGIIKVYRYEYKDGKIDPESKVLEQHNKYNDKDLLIEKTDYFRGKLMRKSVYQYNDKGLMIEEAYTDYEAPQNDEKLWGNGKTVYKYNDKDSLIEKTDYFSSGGLIYKYLYKYNDKGLLIEETEYNKLGELNYKYVYNYNDKNLKIEETKYDEQSKPDRKSVYDYNNKDLLIEETSTYDDNGELRVVKSVYNYNDKDLLIEKADYLRGELMRKSVYNYNDKGLKIEEAYTYYDEQGEPQRKYCYGYEYK